MGYYLNSSAPLSLYESASKKPYFVDKTKILEELIPLVEQGNNHICITRPRRFGKSVMAAMIGAFFTKGVNSSSVFDSLKIAENPQYQEYLNQYNVIYINFSDAANISSNYDSFIRRIEKSLSRDLHHAFPKVEFWEESTLMEDLSFIYETTTSKFILVMDEWDCIFHKTYITDNDRRNFINYLSALTKDKDYISLTYMTGVLPISKYSSGSSINHFMEYTMATKKKFATYFGFTGEEVDTLYERYLKNENDPQITREELDFWYNGYSTLDGTHIYNPRSLVSALTNNQIASYWTESGAYNEIADYIVNDTADVKQEIAWMVTGEKVKADITEYAAANMSLTTKDEILSAMVVYGFLNYKDGYVSIPNNELRVEFAQTIKKETFMDYFHNLSVASDAILQATLNKDADTVAKALADVHDMSPIKAYNSEAELSLVVFFAYLSAINRYQMKREDQGGRGYVDYVFYPRNHKDDAIILELKKDDTPDAAIQQIKSQKYDHAFRGLLGEKDGTGHRILAVGITYDSKSGEHRCKIEEVNESS